MRRRQFVTSATATVAATSIAGCSGILGGDGGGSGPGNAVKTYIEAGVAGDEEALQEAIHPEASQEVAMSASMMAMVEDASVTNTEVVEEDGDTATVEATVEASMGGETSEGTSRYEVRTHDGEWKVYAILD